MHVLILGGTVFLGRHLVDAALAAGHQVTLFHRGRHAAHRAAEVEQVAGDRGNDLNLLSGRHFDAVIDTCAYLPRHVAMAAAAIDTDHYTLVSSGSVYALPGKIPLAENGELCTPASPDETRTDGEWYGPQKVGCEQALIASRRSVVLVLRAGLLAGPHDPTDRLTYWATRMQRPGPVLAPDVPDQPVQFIDARDSATWMLRAAAAGITGTMNVNGPRGELTFAELLQMAGPAEVRWVAEQTLLDAGVQFWSELPLWLPERFGVLALMQMSTDRARAAGLRTRPVEQTLADIREWAMVDPVRVEADYGTRARSVVLTAEREAELLLV